MHSRNPLVVCSPFLIGQLEGVEARDNLRNAERIAATRAKKNRKAVQCAAFLSWKSEVVPEILRIAVSSTGSRLQEYSCCSPRRAYAGCNLPSSKKHSPNSGSCVVSKMWPIAALCSTQNYVDERLEWVFPPLNITPARIRDAPKTAETGIQLSNNWNVVGAISRPRTKKWVYPTKQVRKSWGGIMQVSSTRCAKLKIVASKMLVKESPLPMPMSNSAPPTSLPRSGYP